MAAKKSGRTTAKRRGRKTTAKKQSAAKRGTPAGAAKRAPAAKRPAAKRPTAKRTAATKRSATGRNTTKRAAETAKRATGRGTRPRARESAVEAPAPPSLPAIGGTDDDSGRHAPMEPMIPVDRPERPRFDPSKLDRTVIALPLVEKFARGDADDRYPVVIDLNLDYKDGRKKARDYVIGLVIELTFGVKADLSNAQHQKLRERLERTSPQQYVAAKLTQAQIARLVDEDVKRAADDWKMRGIYRIWPDFEVRACLTKSVMTIKADAARIAFNAAGKDIVWAVMDSGIDATHLHFHQHRNLEVKEPVRHESFVADDDDPTADNPLADAFGHGTHVAGIIAGCLPTRPNAAAAAAAKSSRTKAKAPEHRPVYSAHGVREERGETALVALRPVEELTGIAPQCKLVSMKVLNHEGCGTTAAIMRALQRIYQINQHGRRLLIHGVNLSLGYDFEPEWFACGQSPLCVEVDRLVRSGVVVVVAAGNSGYGYYNTSFTGVKAAGLQLTINDPGNAERAITVGSTHRESPHLYGASFFSSKGPTGDGRNKPDVLAPGEKILSCAAGAKKIELLARDRAKGSQGVNGEQVQYIEDSGTSMAAPHVSGAIAAFLSVRREFQGQPEIVKELFLKNATDLNRDRYFQGHGLVDLMRTIQSV